MKSLVPALLRLMLAWKVWCVHEKFGACIALSNAGMKKLVHALKISCTHQNFYLSALLFLVPGSQFWCWREILDPGTRMSVVHSWVNWRKEAELFSFFTITGVAMSQCSSSFCVNFLAVMVSVNERFLSII